MSLKNPTPTPVTGPDLIKRTMLSELLDTTVIDGYDGDDDVSSVYSVCSR